MNTVAKECPDCLGDGHRMEDQIGLDSVVPCATCNGYGNVTYDIKPKIVQGDLLELFDNGEFDIIYPGGNHCFCRPEQGLAGKVMKRWPEYQHADLRNGRKGDRTKLGTSIPVTVQRACGSTGLLMLNYTQFMYGRYNHPTELFSLSAVHEIFKVMVSAYAANYKVGMARLGGTLGNADNEAVQMLLELEMKRYFEQFGVVADITIVEFV
ncbi:hypothetical protein [Yersinia ruckeri]|uniref:hypothetical protein n=1 Tax=Yersinia ruckeri TaxID=29486 RepID=UPI002236F5AE|nr:hypothetical protein [Yersinia ruckeri]MCW6598891.1 hypothetical protein [Yersinia ruckeri]